MHATLLLLTTIAGFTTSGQFQEQVRVIPIDPGVTATIVAPPARQFDPARPTLLVIYALPNGNTTAQTIGRAGAGLDWHFDIQNIGAQTRLLRQAFSDRNIVAAYLENNLLSWPAWRQKNPRESLVAILDRTRQAIPGPSPRVCLTGHSGGGSFIFGYLNEVEAIPSDIERIALLDSNYSFEDTHGGKLIAWLKGDSARRLEVIAYDDRNIEVNGKKVVSDTGGTYRASFRMVESLRKGIPLEQSEQGPFIRFTAPQVEMLIHRNPENKILHTLLIGEMNAYIHALTVGTPWERRLAALVGASGDGPRAYSAFVEEDPEPAIPARASTAIGGAAFIESIRALGREAREAAILRELLIGNIPSFLRRLVSVTVKVKLDDGVEHTATFDVMPDYLAIGSDADFVRMPMNPYTAQAFCDAAGLVLPTRKMSRDIWGQAQVRLIPQPLTEARESPTTFLESHRLIEQQAAGVRRGTIWVGIKKDIVISNLLTQREHRLAIYGWHYPSGEPIQPLTTVHVDWYVDYSHGARAVRRTVKVDGREMSYEEVLRDPKLSPLLSDEGPIPQPRYVRAIP
jgi:hypothetical protein